MGYFPVKILITKTKETRVCKTVNDLPNGQAFKVLETNYKGEDQ